MSRASWYLFLSNEKKDSAEALSIYWRREIIKKAFELFQNNTQEQNFAAHSQNHIANKLFVYFLTLILTSQIHKTMCDENLYAHYTIIEIFIF